jgi:small subunit ribosomal protein S2
MSEENAEESSMEGKVNSEVEVHEEESRSEIEGGSETVEEVVEKTEINVEFLVRHRVHYGRRTKTTFSEDYIYRTHPRGFFLIDVKKTIEKLKVAAKFLSRFPPDKVIICSAREYAERGIEKMCEITGMASKTGRFLPGTLTNYVLKEHREVDLIFVVDHNYDKQAVKEATKMKIPVISFVDTNSFPRLVDLAIPANSKGRSSLAALFWSLTVLYLRARGLLGEDEVIDLPVEDFMVAIE